MRKLLIGSFVIVVLCTLFISTHLDIFKRAAANSAGSGKNKTTLALINTTSDSVLIYLTLSGYPDSIAANYVQNVDSIFGITQTGLVGTFYLHASDTLTYTSNLYFSGNLSFGTPPLNCPDSAWPTGMSIFEFNLNEPQESIDISCMAGVNCIMSVDLIKGPDWAATPSFPNVRHMQNDSMGKNTNLLGVYPYGCTNCTNTEGKQACQSPADTPDSSAICNPTRAKGANGGVVQVTFKGYTNYQICKKQK